MRLRHLLSFILLFVFGSAFAVSSPITMLDSTANSVISALKAKKASLKTNPSVVYQIVNTRLLPNVDVYGMSRSVLGRSAWKKATKAQRHRFSQEFTKLVVRTYSGALRDFTSETVRFMPLRGGYAGKKRVKVNSVIIRKKGPSIKLSYRVVLKGGLWKVYDMSVEGVSLLQSFRSQFAAELSKGSFEDLIQKLVKHNSSRT